MWSGEKDEVVLVGQALVGKGFNEPTAFLVITGPYENIRCAATRVHRGEMRVCGVVTMGHRKKSIAPARNLEKLTMKFSNGLVEDNGAILMASHVKNSVKVSKYQRYNPLSKAKGYLKVEAKHVPQRGTHTHTHTHTR